MSITYPFHPGDPKRGTGAAWARTFLDLLAAHPEFGQHVIERHQALVDLALDRLKAPPAVTAVWGHPAPGPERDTKVLRCLGYASVAISPDQLPVLHWEGVQVFGIPAEFPYLDGDLEQVVRWRLFDDVSMGALLLPVGRWRQMPDAVVEGLHALLQACRPEQAVAISRDELRAEVNQVLSADPRVRFVALLRVEPDSGWDIRPALPPRPVW